MSKGKSKLAQLIGNYSVESKAKAAIASHFHRDAYDWIGIFETLESHYDVRMSARAKCLVNLNFALECDLKAFAVLLSKRDESAECIYRKLRRCSHKLVELERLCREMSQGKYRIISPKFRDKLSSIDKIGVSVRYDLDLKTAYKLQSFEERILNSGTISSILTHEFSDAIYTEARELHIRVQKAFKRRFTKIIAHEEQVNDRLKEILRR